MAGKPSPNELSQVDLSGPGQFEQYCAEVAKSACPHIYGSIQRDLHYCRLIDMSSIEADLVEAHLLLAALKYTELFRSIRRAAGPKRFTTPCINLVFQFSPDVAPAARHIFGWPHWICKCLYLKKRIMHGKFWRGEEVASNFGKKIPVPTLDFISIRTSIPTRDKVLLGEQHSRIISDLAAGLEDNESVLDNFGIDGKMLESSSDDNAVEIYWRLREAAEHFES
jgi:hypothetical protein